MTTLAFDLYARDHGAKRSIREFSNETDRATASFSKWKTVALAAGTAVAAGVIKFGRDSVAAYSDAQAQQAKLAFAFQKFPKLADTNQAALQGLNSELQRKTRFDDDALASGQAVLAQFNLTGRQITQVTPLLADYAAKTGQDIPDAAKNVGRALLGNTRALKAIGINYKSTGDAGKDFANITELMRQKIGGFAEDQGKTASGRLEILKNQFGELEESAGKRLVPALTALVGGLTTMVEWVGANERTIGPLVITVGGLALGMLAAKKAVDLWRISQGLMSGLASKGVAGLNALKVAFTGVELTAKGAGRAMRVAELSIPVVGVALFAVTEILSHFASKGDDATQTTNDFAQAMQTVKGNVTLATAALDENVRAVAVSGLQAKGAYEQAKLLGISFGTVTDAALGNKDAIAEVNRVTSAAAALNPQLSKSNSDLANTAGALSGTLIGQATNAKAAADAERVRRVAMGQGSAATVTLAGLTGQLRDKEAGLNSELQKSINKFTILKQGALDAGQADIAWEQALDGLSKSTGNNTTQTHALMAARLSEEAASRKVQAAESHLHELRKTGQASASQLKAAEDSLQGARDRLKLATDRVNTVEGKSSRSLNVNTEAGRTNRSAVIGMITALNDKTTADVKNAGVVHKGETATTVYSRVLRVATNDTRHGEAQIRAAARAAGLNAVQVDNMIRQYLKTPKQVATDVRTRGVRGALNDIHNVQRALVNVKSRSVDIHFSTNAYKIGQTKFAVNLTAPSSVGRSAAGGLIRGPGSGTSDSILGMDHGGMVPTSWVSNGEFVVNAKQTAKHRAMLEAVNSGLEGFASGGTIGRSLTINAGQVPASAMQLPRVAGWFTSSFAKEAGSLLGKGLAAGLQGTMSPGVLGPGALVGSPNGLVRVDGVGSWSRLFAANIARAEHAAGRRFIVYQAGWNHGRVAASGSTHDGDAIDAHQDALLLRMFRRYVGAMWFRNWPGNYHMHGVPAPGRGYGSAAARWQYQDYLHGGDGLATGGLASRPGLYPLAERAPERVLSPRQTLAFEQMVRLIDRGNAGGNTYIVNVSAPHVYDTRGLERALVTTLQTGRLDKVIQRTTR